MKLLAAQLSRYFFRDHVDLHTTLILNDQCAPYSHSSHCIVVTLRMGNSNAGIKSCFGVPGYESSYVGNVTNEKLKRWIFR